MALTLEAVKKLTFRGDRHLKLASKRHEGDYERRFTLSNEIDQDKIEATVSNGVLHLRLPKAGPAKARKIAVKAA